MYFHRLYLVFSLSSVVCVLSGWLLESAFPPSDRTSRAQADTRSDQSERGGMTSWAGNMQGAWEECKHSEAAAAAAAAEGEMARLSYNCITVRIRLGNKAEATGEGADRIYTSIICCCCCFRRLPSIGARRGDGQTSLAILTKKCMCRGGAQ